MEQCLDNEGGDEKESDFHLTVQDVHRIATLRCGLMRGEKIDQKDKCTIA